MLPEYFVWFAVVINFVGQVIYLKSIVFGNTKPNSVSWVIWTLAPFIGVFLQLKAGAKLSVLPVFMAGFGPLLVVIFSSLYKRARWKVTQFDLICGAISILSLILYIATHNLAISIVFAILSDGLAAIPTLIKSWKFPESESPSIYLFGVISNIIGLMIIKNWQFAIYSFGAYIIILNILIVIFIYRKKIIY